MSATEGSVAAAVDPNASAPVEITPPVDGTPPAQDPAAQPPVDRDAAGRFRNPVQPRIDELTRKARENEREAAFWKARAQALETPPPKPPEKPKPEDFDDYGAYVEALTDFKADERIKTTLDSRDKAATEKSEADKRSATYLERAAAAAKSIPDYEATVSTSDVPIAQHVTEELLDSEFGPQIAYHLAKNPELADELNAMSPKAAARKIGRLEAQFADAAAAPADPDPSETPSDPQPAPTPPAPAAPRVKTTNAPPPPKPLGSGRGTTVDLAKASMDEYVEARKKQGASWAR